MSRNNSANRSPRLRLLDTASTGGNVACGINDSERVVAVNSDVISARDILTDGDVTMKTLS